MGAGAWLASLGELDRRDRPSRRRAPRFGGNTRLPHHVISQAGALFVMDDTRWDQGLTVTGEGQGLVGHAGAVLLRKLADRAGLTAALGAALARKGKFPLVDRGVALVSMAVAIVLGATSMSDITVLAHHAPVLAAAIRQIPARMRSELLVRVDGAGASHELISHLLSLSSRRRTVLFTSGWAITEADEQAIGLLPASAWQTAVDQDGVVQEDKHAAEITHLTSRAAGWPSGLRWIVRRTRPSRRQAGNLTAFERATGWRYSIIVTNIPAAGGIGGVPGSHHAQFIDVLHRQHAIVEDGVGTAQSH